MRTLVAALCVLVILCGCQVPSDIRTADQAKERANYLKAQAAAYEKEAAAAEKVAENLREDVQRERIYLQEYEERAHEAAQSVSRLETQTPETEGESRAIQARIDTLQNRLEAMEVKAGERREIIRTIELRISQQQRHARDCRNHADELFQEAKKIERRGKRLAEQKSFK